MSSLPDPLLGVVLNDRYRIDAKIARGGMAMVYRGTDLRLDREIAIKVMHEHLISDETFVERFRREAINAGRLTHPNLVAIHDQARDGDIVYLVMEHLPSVTLRRELKHRGSFTPRQAIVVLDAILAALEAVHSTGIIHRDLKPDNVLLGTDGQVKLADFGLARAVTSATTTKTLIGTVGYVAPELVTRAGADARTDLYTVGIMFYEMLTGTQPYTDDVRSRSLPARPRHGPAAVGEGRRHQPAARRPRPVGDVEGSRGPPGGCRGVPPCAGRGQGADDGCRTRLRRSRGRGREPLPCPDGEHRPR